MTPFTAIYHKEFQENRWMLPAVFGACASMLLYGVFENAYDSAFRWLENAKLFGLCAVGAVAALSYASETEQKTATFLRSIPVGSLTLLRGKLAWIGTAVLAVFLLLFGIQIICFGPTGMSPLQWLLSAFSMVAWGLFWSTRWSGTLMAVLSTWLTQLVLILLLSLIYPFHYSDITFYGYDYQFSSLGASLEKFYISGNIAPIIISAVVSFFALWRASQFLEYSEKRKNTPSGGRGDEKSSAGFEAKILSGVFRMKKWGPLQAMLWQSIRQSVTILRFGVVLSLFFTVWCLFYGNEFAWVCSARLDFSKPVYSISSVLLLVGSLFALGFSSTVFSQDQENGMFRALAQRGIAPGLVWWSRLLPFLLVYSIPAPMIFHLAFDRYVLSASPVQGYEFAATVLLVYYTPICVGTLTSMICRDIISSIFLTFIVSIFLTPYIFVTSAYSNCGFSFAALTILAGFLAASRWMTADWLRERPLVRRMAIPAGILGIAFVLAFLVFVYTTLVPPPFCS